ncbi:MAG: hypothetical protein JO022_04450, partial [Acidobacteriaceae bacterium]|nr:hypothetical protein [Acidobacteriaceae bacterium]
PGFIISILAALSVSGVAQDGKTIVTAAPPEKKECVPLPLAAAWCVPAPLVGPPPMLPPPPPVVYCERKLPRTNQTRVPDEVHAYAIGRTPNGEGGMDEAHLYYRIVQSAHWDLRLPAKKQATALTTGPKEVFYPPTYQPPPHDQRVRDAMAAADQARLAAEQAQRNFESATEDIHKKLQEDNQLKDEIQELLKQNQQLREQLDGGHAHPSPTASASKSKVPQDQLKDWENHLIQYSGPSVTGTPSDK